MSRHRRRRGRPDFWRDWHAAEGTAGGSAGPQRSPRVRARIFREFFHEYMGAYPEEHWAFGGRRFSPWRQGRVAFNPLVAGVLSKGGGLLPLYVLHLLARQPRYGNEIMELLAERTAGRWVANPGAIYPLMQLLEEQGLVAGLWDDPVKRTVRQYRLTAAGVDELWRLKAVVRPKLQEAIRVLQQLDEDLNSEADKADVR